MIDIKNNNRNWIELLKKPDSFQISEFYEACNSANSEHVKNGFRKFSCDLFKRDLIDMDEYVSVFGGHAVHHISLSKSGKFYDMKAKNDARLLTEIYSRAKYGAVEDIYLLAKNILRYLYTELNNANSSWSILFKRAQLHGEHIVLMTTGWRNVPSTANVLFDIVVENINIKLAEMNYPTIINVKLPRISPPCENYASLTFEEREAVNLKQDHVIPAKNFYHFNNIHVIFGDDVMVTGSTADKLMYESLNNGAKSFRSIYAVAIDPRVGLIDATIEDLLNTSFIKECLDDNFAKILSDNRYQPILRTLRLLFCGKSRNNFVSLLSKVPLENWLKLYMSALNNEFFSQKDCRPSLDILKKYLETNGYLSENGFYVTFNDSKLDQQFSSNS